MPVLGACPNRTQFTDIGVAVASQKKGRGMRI